MAAQGGKIHRVTLTGDGRARLRETVDGGRGLRERRGRAHILLPADRDRPGGGRRDAGIADVPGVGAATGGRVRGQCVTEGVGAAPGRRVQANRRQRLPDGEGEARLTVPARPEPPGGQARWTLRLPADRLVALGVVETIPTETVRGTPGKTASGPGRASAGAYRRKRTPASSARWRTSSTRTAGTLPTTGCPSAPTGHRGGRRRRPGHRCPRSPAGPPPATSGTGAAERRTRSC